MNGDSSAPRGALFRGFPQRRAASRGPARREPATRGECVQRDDGGATNGWQVLKAWPVAVRYGMNVMSIAFVKPVVLGEPGSRDQYWANTRSPGASPTEAA